ncbi:unnamed protein product [Lactuca virosa]|uniref:Uncharacterized protein n=1 Tax=Lactuca virosa TaxID=75947 RepID=A0AAU9M1V2_9ASTR|nr:unnamed protein product [Lactuca virosa]
MAASPIQSRSCTRLSDVHIVLPFCCLKYNSIQVGDEGLTLPYWLSNAPTLFYILQRNFWSNDFFFLTSSSGVSFLSSGGLHKLVISFCIEVYTMQMEISYSCQKASKSKNACWIYVN